jgi:hypothetical protein
LRQLVHDAADGGAGGAMRLTRHSNGAAFSVLVSPLPPPYRDPTLRLLGTALVIIKDLADEKPPAVSCLKVILQPCCGHRVY